MSYRSQKSEKTDKEILIKYLWNAVTYKCEITIQGERRIAGKWIEKLKQVSQYLSKKLKEIKSQMFVSSNPVLIFSKLIYLVDYINAQRPLKFILSSSERWKRKLAEWL